MDPVFTTLGATIGLVLAIALVLLRMQPAYALMAGTLVGGLAGGGAVDATVAHAVAGARGMPTAMLRILASGDASPSRPSPSPRSSSAPWACSWTSAS